MAPAVGVSRPAMRFSTVDLPQPEGPTMQTNSPAATSRSAPETASVSLPVRGATKDLETPASRSFGAPPAPAGGRAGGLPPQGAGSPREDGGRPPPGRAGPEGRGPAAHASRRPKALSGR